LKGRNPAERPNKSRSQLHAEALAEYLSRHSPEEVTEAMNRIVDRLGEPGLDQFAAESARRTLERSPW